MPGNSLASQWLGLHVATAGSWGSIPGQGTKILGCCMARPKRKKKAGLLNHRAKTKQVCLAVNPCSMRHALTQRNSDGMRPTSWPVGSVSY